MKENVVLVFSEVRCLYLFKRIDFEYKTLNKFL